MAGNCWYYLTESRRRVAVPDLDFQPLISSGVITAETMVWTEGMEDWMAAGEIHPELFGDASAPASTDLPTVLQMVRSISAPVGRASAALRISALLLVLISIALATLTVVAAWMASDIYGGRGWFILLGLIPSAIPALFAQPLSKIATAPPSRDVF